MFESVSTQKSCDDVYRWRHDSSVFKILSGFKQTNKLNLLFFRFSDLKTQKHLRMFNKKSRSPRSQQEAPVWRVPLKGPRMLFLSGIQLNNSSWSLIWWNLNDRLGEEWRVMKIIYHRLISCTLLLASFVLTFHRDTFVLYWNAPSAELMWSTFLPSSELQVVSCC